MEGTAFGRYQLLQLLGRGGMGEVWRAHDPATDRIVAIKLLPAHLSDDELFQQRFRREAHAAARLNNPHVIPIHFYGEIDGRLYVDMRLIEGHDLQEVLAAGPLPPARAVGIIEQVAQAVHAAHKVGLVHRDIKPSNILLDDNDFAYLIDFGIARAVGETGLTATGGVIGTLGYMAPERFGTGQSDARSDIYALTCVLYECLTGHRPFPGDSLEQQLAGHLTAPPPRPSHTHPGVPAELDTVIATGMAKLPEQRYPSTVALARAARDASTVPITRPQPGPTVPVQLPTQPAAAPTAPATFAAGPPTPPPRPFSTAAATQQQARHDAPTSWRQEFTTSPVVPTPSPRRWWRRKAVLMSAAFVAVVAIVAAVTLAIPGNQPLKKSAPPATSEPRQTTQPPQYAAQETLPFNGLNKPVGVRVDIEGTVYVADSVNNRVLTLRAGSTNPTVLPFTGLEFPYGVTVDNNGTIYVTQYNNDGVVTLRAGSATPTVLPITGLNRPNDVTVDSNGTVYVADTYNDRVVTLPAGSTTQTVLPFTGLKYPDGVAVDGNGTVYVTDYGNNRVVTLPAGSTTQTVLPFTGLFGPDGVAVDGNGTVYVTEFDNNRVVTMPAGSNMQTVLPFTGLNHPAAVAVDNNGTVYVTDNGNNRVVVLAAV